MIYTENNNLFIGFMIPIDSPLCLLYDLMYSILMKTPTLNNRFGLSPINYCRPHEFDYFKGNIT